MPQISVEANCVKDENGLWHPDGTGQIFTDRDADNCPCNTPLEPQKTGQNWVPRCEGKLSWRLDWSYLWEDETEQTDEPYEYPTVQCPICKCVYEIIQSG